MLLAVDVGNTNIVLGVYRGAGAAAELISDWRLRTDRDRTTDEYGILTLNLLRHGGLDANAIRHVAISSVVPTMNETLGELSRRYFHTEPFSVGPRTDTGITIRYQPASDVGADRICNAVGAFAKYGGPAIVVDFGHGDDL